MIITKRDLEWFLENMPERMDLNMGIEILKKLAKVELEKSEIWADLRLSEVKL